jgi:hypothetical protein
MSRLPSPFSHPAQPTTFHHCTLALFATVWCVGVGAGGGACIARAQGQRLRGSGFPCQRLKRRRTVVASAVTRWVRRQVPGDALERLKDAQTALTGGRTGGTLADTTTLRDKFIQVRCAAHSRAGGGYGRREGRHACGDRDRVDAADRAEAGARMLRADGDGAARAARGSQREPGPPCPR